ncbi:MAG: hypothetical protein SGBAC_002519 [Bacillariaceae sp.]
MPTSLSTSANNDQNTYPSANAVLLNNDSSAYAPPAMATAVAATSVKEASFRDQYASAHVVGTDISPFSTRLAQATETHATATALDPWSKQKTVAAETQEQETNQAPTFVYHPPSSDYTSPNEYGNNDENNNNGTAILPAAALEDPMHKKYRRRIRRRGRMIAFGAAGFVVGSIVLGPFGAVALGVGGASAAKAASKAGERRKDKRVRKKIQRMQHQRDQGNLERIVITRR